MQSSIVRFEGHGGLPLTAEVWGNPNAWPVLLLHGGGQTRHAWGGTAQSLARAGWRAISMDLRGHGDSGWAADGDYAFTSYAEDTIRVCDALGRPPILVGASLGGVSAIIAEGTAKRTVSAALVIVDITHQTNPEGIDRIKDFMMSGIGGFASLDDAAAAIAAYTPHRKRAANPAGLQKVLRQKDDGRWYWHWDPRFMLRDGSEDPGGPFDQHFERALGQIKVPTLLVRGKLSDVITEEGVQDFLRRVPQAKLADVSDAAHMVAGDQNDVFSSAVIEFLEKDVRPTLPR